MSFSGAGPSEPVNLQLHYTEMIRDSQLEEEGGDSDYDPEMEEADDDEEMEEAENNGEMEEAKEGTTDSGVGGGGSETTGQAKRCRNRKPNKVGSVRQKFDVVDPSGVPKEPLKFAKGYGLQCAAICREIVNLNEVNIQAKNKEHLRVQLIARLHARYQFPDPYDNQDLKTNVVNTHALTKFTAALSGFKTYVRDLLKEGADYEKIHNHFPKVTEADLAAFKINEELDHTKDSTSWGKRMRDMNVGNHRLGSRGYDGKEPIWRLEDEAYEAAGMLNPYKKFKSKEAANFVRSRFHKVERTGN